MKNIRELENHRTVYEYSQLSPEAKEKARQEVIAYEEQAYTEMLDKTKDSIAAGKIHRIINLNNIRGLLSLSRICNRLKKDIDYCEKMIESNLTHFTKEGEYVTYIQNKSRCG